MTERASAPVRRAQQQRGVFAVATALAMVVMLGFVGLAIDASRLQLVQAELQNAADACALAAVLELNGLSDAPSRGALAGQFVGGARNRRNFQADLVSTDQVSPTFSTTLNGSYQSASGGAAAASRFARCAVTQPSLRHFFMGLVGIGTSNLVATATATVMPSQSVCAIPMAICQGAGPNANTFGYQLGDLIALGTSQVSGFFTWANVLGIDASGSLEPYAQAFVGFGFCEVPTAADRCIGIHTGVVTSLDDGWNARFGVYKQGGSGLDPALAIPDLTGYGYRPPPVGGAYSDYTQNRAPSRQAFQGHIPSYTSPANVHTQYGASSRRLVPMPVVACSSSACGSGAKPILGWACALMLSPKTPTEDAEIEFRGRADDPLSGCRTAGLPGGTDASGPLVPVLVQ
ncbi:MAG: pilus assembly protein TadG-related protein [Polaromonas sp.]|nr:pilus assembly protein TadG-related protein [Polaromonas sp.]